MSLQGVYRKGGNTHTTRSVRCPRLFAEVKHRAILVSGTLLYSSQVSSAPRAMEVHEDNVNEAESVGCNSQSAFSAPNYLAYDAQLLEIVDPG